MIALDFLTASGFTPDVCLPSGLKVMFVHQLVISPEVAALVT
jgi:hypothetical protein